MRELRPTVAIAAIAGVLGALGCALGLALDPARTLAAYLAAWITVATTAVGGLGVLLLGHATNARWPATIRRIGEAIAASLVCIAALALPLLVAQRDVWPPSHLRYLAPPFFTLRAVLYLAIWVAIAEVVRAWSLRGDAVRRLSAAMLPVVGLTVTFASFDWLMSLEPGWWSSGFGLYVLSAALRAGLALTIVLAWRGLPLRPPHFHAMGRLLHAFVIVWAYLAYFQVMLIQIADRPDEVTFYLHRSAGGWHAVTWAIIALGFVVPFPLLLWRRLKQRAAALAAVAIAVLGAHALEMWWLVLPRVSPAPLPSWSDLAAFAACAGLPTAVAAWRMRGVPIVPIGDPYLAEGLRYEPRA
jgi:hypothetical protein